MNIKRVKLPKHRKTWQYVLYKQQQKYDLVLHIWLLCCHNK